MGLDLKERTVRGETLWVLDLGLVSGKRKRRFFRERREAESALAEAERGREDFGRRYRAMRKAERDEVGQILAEMEEAGTTLRQVWAEWMGRPRAKPITVGEAVQRCVADKLAGNRRPSYLRQLEFFLVRFAKGRAHRRLDSLTSDEVGRWLADVGGAPATRRGNISRLGALFDWARRHGFMATDILKPVERPKLDEKPAEILSVRQCCRLLVWCKRHAPDSLAFVCLGLFCGMRPDEAGRMGWEDIRLDEGTVNVSGAAGKVRRRRVIHLTDQAADWLAYAKSVGGVLPLTVRQRVRRQLQIRQGLRWKDWPQDVLRKTFASNTVTLWQDAAKVALEMGTSVRMIFSHYREVVGKADAARFAKLRPRKIWRR